MPYNGYAHNLRARRVKVSREDTASAPDSTSRPLLSPKENKQRAAEPDPNSSEDRLVQGLVMRRGDQQGQRA